MYNLVTDITCISLFYRTDTKYDHIFVILFTQQENTKLFFQKYFISGILSFLYRYDNHPVKKIKILIYVSVCNNNII